MKLSAMRSAASRPRDGAVDDEQRLRHVVAPAVLGLAHVEVGGAGLGERLARDLVAVDDPRLFLNHVGAALGGGRHDRLGRDVAVADVLGQRALDQLLECFGFHGRRRFSRKPGRRV